jgi:hypothetical protein
VSHGRGSMRDDEKFANPMLILLHGYSRAGVMRL